jgi:hypothetical protein
MVRKGILFFILMFLPVTSEKAFALDFLKGVMPGQVSRLHEKFEGKCLDCHSLFQNEFFDKCLSCHKQVKEDVDQKQGYHGRIDASRCETCHTDHKGRAYGMIEFDPERFDHDQTDFKLKGKHKRVKCSDCHLKPKFHETPQDCYSCHKKDDKHKGVLGKKCGQCHTDKVWKEILFDHDKTRFKLTGKHVKVDCLKCHTTPELRATPRDCYGCHKKDDKHEGKLGNGCDRCHSDEDWKAVSFDHSTTRYPLLGKHAAVSCIKCHDQERWKIPTICASCHRKDDKHKGLLGRVCEKCHTEFSWRRDISRFDHQKTKFPLLDKHVKVLCEECHKTLLFKDTSTVCYDCHKKDDYHKGRFGEKCEACHTEKHWQWIPFNHIETGYPLIKKHSGVKCEKCHVKPLYIEKTSRLCVSCHKKDDVHKGELGTRCERCHTEAGWKRIKK